MRSALHWIAAALLLFAGAEPAPAQSPATSPAGDWKGGIELPSGAELPILVTLTPAPDGWSGSIDIPAQGLAGFALADVTVEGSAVSFAMDGIPGRPTFDGELAEAGDTLSGSFSQGGQQLTFFLDRVDSAAKEEGPAAVEPVEGVTGEGPVGHWLGSLHVGPAVLRLALDVEATADGGFSAILDSIDQGAVIPVDRVRYREGKLSLEIDAIGGSYEGTLNADGSAFVGTWIQSGQSLDLTFLRQAERFTLNRPQEPQEPFPYETRNMVFPGGDKGEELAGTVVVPQGDGPFPAVVSPLTSLRRDDRVQNSRFSRILQRTFRDLNISMKGRNHA